MTWAEAERVEPDPGRANEFLAQARGFLRDAERLDTSSPSAVVLYWEACTNAMEAVLIMDGWRVSGGEGSHRVRVETAFRLLDASFADLGVRLDLWRRERNDVSYRAATTSGADADAMHTDAQDVLAAATDHVRRRGERA